MGSGDWWNEVNTTASAQPSARIRSTTAATSSGRTGGAGLITHGAGQTRTRRTPGSSRAASAPAGPHSTATSAAAATARTAGPASSTSPAPSRRTTSTRRVTR